MKLLKFLFFLTLTIVLVWALNRPWDAGKGNKTPRMGYFLSPGAGFWQNAEGDKPNYPTSISSSKLKGAVDVRYDEYMVPHIFAENTEDAMFAQGYITASMRLWQMEFQTHAAAGRISEIVGDRHPAPQKVLEFDQRKRREGLPRAARKAVEAWQKEPEWKYMQAYSDGINAYINSLSENDYPIEYKLLDYAPEQWSPYKTALLLKYMAEMLTSRGQDVENTNAYQLLGKSRFAKLYPEFFPEQSPIILDSTFAYTKPPVADPTQPNANIN
ncbi:MAG: penicillin acylase family protein, partial [Saprospiraceae bacterium]|nr:penicillin acylase family protein [Saprospiraceae bacterium]